jgi:DNA polymerase I-like protein with 3'-5' exonuclease and polymerase domains
MNPPQYVSSIITIHLVQSYMNNITKPKTSLAEHIAKLKAKEAANPKSKQADDAIIFWGTHFDKNYLPHLKGCVGSATTFLRLEEVTTLTTVKMYCSQKKVTRVISTSISLLKKLLYWDKKKAPSLANYAGSYFTISGFKDDDPEIEIVFIQPLKHLVTVTYGKFMATRTIGKLTKPDKWYTPTTFSWQILKPENEEIAFHNFKDAFLICIDIETFKENATIRCLSFTAFYTKRGEIVSDSVVLPLDSEYNLAIMRKWCWELKAPKVMQNGKYDISYLARYNSPVYNYLYDTANLFHCWYSELPKDLGFLNSFFIREAVYWKDLAETNDLHEYYRYNALDTWGTGNAFLAMLLEAPKFAIDNYLLEFPLTFPCHLSEMTGINRDMSKFSVAKAEQQEIIDKQSAKLNTILDVKAFNVKSPIQMKQLFKILGCSDLKSQDEKNVKKARFRHPFNARVLGLVLEIRKARTLISNYLTEGKEFARQDGTGSRFLYSLNPQATDSSRLASKSHHFWCGDNIQKIPRGPIIKQTFKADDGFLLAEVDLEQAESRDTAYISGDLNLIQNVEHSPDFHCANASAFFGIPFEELYDTLTHKKLNTKIRDLAKNVNHGANYNMGPFVLVETMGEENVAKAKKLLGLPRFWTYIQVAEHLLAAFHKTYPSIKEVFYEGVVAEIIGTKLLKSMALHHSWEDNFSTSIPATEAALYHLHGTPRWTRYCFGSPSTNKQHLNSYISHPPQSLNAQTLNKAYLTVFHDIANHPKHSHNFKLTAQIHDSIFFQYRIGHNYLCDMVKERMEIPITIKAYDGDIRTFVVPA